MQESQFLSVCLQTHPYREADVNAVFFTPEQGALRAMVRGIKKIQAKLAGACEPMAINQLTVQTSGRIPTVIHYHRVQSFSALRDHLEAMAAGNVATELLRLVAHENDPDAQATFDTYTDCLKQLDAHPENWSMILLQYHLAMLVRTGYAFDWEVCVQCGGSLVSGIKPYACFLLDQGGFICSACEPHYLLETQVKVSRETIQLLQAMGRSENIAFPHDRLHGFLAYYWSDRLERPLKSMDFLKQCFVQNIRG